MPTTITTEQLGKHVGAIVSGINAAEPATAQTARVLHDLYLQHGLLLFRDQQLTPAQHIEFSRIFGGLDLHPLKQVRLEGHPEIIALSNKGQSIQAGEEDDVIGKIPWHSDLMFVVRPSRGALLYAKAVPEEGGETGFADTAAAYDGLSDEMKERIDGLEVLHSFYKIKQNAAKIDSEPSEGAKGDQRLRSTQNYVDVDEYKPSDFPDVIHPLVVTHPESGRKALNVSPSFAMRIVGLPEAEGNELPETLTSHAIASRFGYVHHWRVGDIIIWDNWRTMHMATGHKAKNLRTMHRTTLSAECDMGRLAA